MPVERRFLGWNGPLLALAVDELARFAPVGATFDLGAIVVVTPTSAAGRRLLELLVERAAQYGRPLVPPRIVTPGELPELLYETKLPFASELNQELAWVEALQSLTPAQLVPLLPFPPTDDDLAAWRELAGLLIRLHRELAADNLAIDELLTLANQLPGFNETPRWRVLADLRARYLSILDGLQLWDQQTARLFAIDNQLCRSRSPLVLIGLSDMNTVLRAMLDQLTTSVVALIFAPDSESARFDAHGCLMPSAWSEFPIDLDEQQIVVVDGPADQADAVLRVLASWANHFATNEITIGMVDDQLVSGVQERLAEAKLRGRHAAGTRVSETEPYRLLVAVAEFVERRHANTLAALVRHPAVEAWLRRKGLTGNLLAAIDELMSKRLPTVIDSTLLKSLPSDAIARRVLEAIGSWLKPLTGEPRLPGEWAQAAVDVLLEVYGSITWNLQLEAHRRIVAVCEQFHGAARDLSQLNDQLAPRVRGGEALSWMLDELADKAVPPAADPQAIELLGWLDLPLDDAPALILVGFNEGIVPKSRNGDAFLPDSLRRQLRLEDNERRYARDAYALRLLVASRRQIRVIIGRRTIAGDPLLPSRLLFATTDEQLAPRTLACFRERRAEPRLRLAGNVQCGQAARFGPSRPPPLAEPVTSMRVTEFRDYLACPYRYYLKHRLQLSALSDAGRELDELQFGNLVHDVLAEFGTSEWIHSTDENVVSDFLLAQLDEFRQQRIARATWPAVQVQLEMVRQRLRGFARWQVKWRSEGNEIRFVEASGPAEESLLEVDGRPMFLRGRIDRIDFNAKTREWFIFDYKTSAVGKGPQQTHQARNGEWVDLQLPLYRHLSRGLGVGGIVKLGYIVLPASVEGIKNLTAPWHDADLTAADAVAARVIRAVREERFWPPSPEPPAFGAELACIVGDDRYAVMALEASESEDNE